MPGIGRPKLDDAVQSLARFTRTGPVPGLSRAKRGLRLWLGSPEADLAAEKQTVEDRAQGLAEEVGRLSEALRLCQVRLDLAHDLLVIADTDSQHLIDTHRQEQLAQEVQLAQARGRAERAIGALRRIRHDERHNRLSSWARRLIATTLPPEDGFGLQSAPGPDHALRIGAGG